MKRQGFTFNEDEVRAMGKLFSTLYRGGDTRVMVRSKVVRGLAQKFSERVARFDAEAAAAKGEGREGDAA